MLLHRQWSDGGLVVGKRGKPIQGLLHLKEPQQVLIRTLCENEPQLGSGPIPAHL